MKNKSLKLAKHRNYSELVWQLLVSAMLVIPLPQVAVAAEVLNRFILDTSVERDSNPGQAESDKTPVWLYTLIPQYNLDVSDGLNLWYLQGALVLQQPSNDQVYFDRQDPRLLLGWNRTYQSGNYGLRVGYEQNAGRLLQLQATGVIDNIDNTQRNRFVNATWQHDFSARWSLLNEANYTRTEFDESLASTGPGAIIDFDVSEIKSRLAFANTEKLSTYAELSYLQFMPQAFRDDTDIYRMQFGGDYLVREGFAIGANAGLYTASGQQSDSGWEAGVLASYTLDSMVYRAGLSRNLGSGGLLGLQQVDSLQAAWEFNVSEFNLLGADYTYSMSKSDAAVGLGDIDFQTVNAFYERRLSKRWKTRFAGSYRIIEVDGGRSTGNLVGVTLTYDTAGFLVE